MDNPVSLIISRLWYVSFDFLLQYIIYLDLTSFLRSAVSYDHHFLYCIIHFDVPSYGFSFLMTPFIMIFFLMTLRAILSIHYLRFTASDLPSQMYHCLWSFCLWSFCTFLWLSFFWIPIQCLKLLPVHLFTNLRVRHLPFYLDKCALSSDSFFSPIYRSLRYILNQFW